MDWGVRAATGVMLLTTTLLAFLLNNALDQVSENARQLSELNTRVTVIEQSRFTREMGYSLETRLEQEVDDLGEKIITCLNRIQRNQQCDL